MSCFVCVYSACVWLVNGVGLRVVYCYNLFLFDCYVMLLVIFIVVVV